MSSQALTLRDEQAKPHSNQISDIQRLGGLLAASGYFTDARDAAQAAVKVMAGQELGIPPVASMMGINIIKGKIALGGNLIASRIRAHGYDYKHKQFDNKGCVLEFLSKPDASGKRTVLGDSAFTEEDARAAQITSDMYKKFPRNMYFNRAISNGAKWYTPEVFAGAPVYVPEELGAKVDENGDMVHEEPNREEQARARTETRDRKLAEIRGEAQPAAEPEQTPQPEYQEPSKLDMILVKFTKKTAIAEFFAQMRARFCEVLDVTIYERICAKHDVDDQQEKFGTIGNAKKCFAELWDLYQEQLAKINDIPEEEPAQ